MSRAVSRRIMAVIVAVSTLLLIGALLAPAADGATMRQPPYAERHFAWLLNQDRMRAGLSVLHGRVTLYQIASLRALDMGLNGWFGHDFPALRQLLEENGICYRSVGEVTGWTTVGLNEPLDADGWMRWLNSAFLASSEHASVIYGRAYEQIGVGIVRLPDRTILDAIYVDPC